MAILSQVHPGRSHSGAAQGGINAALANNPDSHDDNPEKHAFDTIKGSDYLADQDAAFQMTSDAPGVIFDMEHWGCPFSRYDDGRIAQRPFGGAGYPRTCYGADKTGHYLLHTLVEQSYKLGIELYIEWFVMDLIVADGTCRGVVAYDMIRGGFESFVADAVVIATGGAGRTYSNSTNAIISTGGGMAMAYRAGVPLKDMEFVQFHPTGLYTTNILMTEGCRGEGGYLINDLGERFMETYAPKMMELAPRDITSRSIATEIIEGRGIGGKDYVYLDLRHLGEAKIAEKLPGIRDLAIHFEGVDPVTEPMPIVPSQHYSMGGIDTDMDGRTVMPGLYAAGECACVSVHGANRLGGNSLLETIVFGKRSGAAAAQQIAGGGGGADAAALAAIAKTAVDAVSQQVEDLAGSNGREDPYAIRAEMITTMKEHFGIYRFREEMQAGLDKLMALKQRCSDIRLRNSGRRVQPRHDPHDRAARHARAGPGDRQGRARAHRVAWVALAHRLQGARRHQAGSSTRWPSSRPTGHRDSTSKPVTLGMFEPKERTY